MSKAVLGQTLTTDTSGSTGTYSAAKVHTSVRLDMAQADAQGSADTIRRDLLTPVVGYGLGWDVPVPVLRAVVEDPDAEDRMVDMLDKVVNKLGLPVPAAEGYRLLGITAPEEGDALMQGEVVAAPAIPFAGKPPEGIERYAGQTGSVPLALERIAALSAEEWHEAETVTAMEAVIRLVETGEAGTLEELDSQLHDLYPNLET